MLNVFHFNPYHIYIEERSWYKNGSEQSAGGYYRISKLLKTPKKGSPVFISSNFSLKRKNSWGEGTVYVPECILYVDKQPNWWS
jgi:hypothetical protein